MSSADAFRPNYTVTDYLLWDGDWELWQGQAVAMTPSPFGPQSRMLVSVASALKEATESANCDATVLAELDWIVDRHTVLRPDVSVVCGREPERHLETAPAMVVEIVSESSRERDVVHKRTIYQQQGIPYYWIVDPISKSLTSLEWSDGIYQAMPVDKTLHLEICETCCLEIDVTRIL